MVCLCSSIAACSVLGASLCSSLLSLLPSWYPYRWSVREVLGSSKKQTERHSCGWDWGLCDRWRRIEEVGDCVQFCQFCQFCIGMNKNWFGANCYFFHLRNKRKRRTDAIVFWKEICVSLRRKRREEKKISVSSESTSSGREPLATFPSSSYIGCRLWMSVSRKLFLLTYCNTTRCRIEINFNQNCGWCLHLLT